MKQFWLSLVMALSVSVEGFVPTTKVLPAPIMPTTSSLFAENGASDEEIVGRRIIVKGDVNGGYYRSCVLNEAGRFRRLIGTMTPPDESKDTAEIYVEGKKKMVDGFIRWCERGNVGLNQVIGVSEVLEEEPTGLYDDFYCKTH